VACLDLNTLSSKVLLGPEENVKKKILLQELNIFYVLEEERALGTKEKVKKADIVSKLDRSILMEEVSWR
jgi:hypothetical protein